MPRKPPLERLSKLSIEGLAAKGKRLNRRMKRHARSIDATYWILSRLPDCLKPPVRASAKRQYRRYEQEMRQMIRIKHEIRRYGILPRELGL